MLSCAQNQSFIETDATKTLVIMSRQVEDQSLSACKEEFRTCATTPKVIYNFRKTNWKVEIKTNHLEHLLRQHIVQWHFSLRMLGSMTLSRTAPKLPKWSSPMITNPTCTSLNRAELINIIPSTTLNLPSRDRKILPTSLMEVDKETLESVFQALLGIFIMIMHSSTTTHCTSKTTAQWAIVEWTNSLTRSFLANFSRSPWISISTFSKIKGPKRNCSRRQRSNQDWRVGLSWEIAGLNLYRVKESSMTRVKIRHLDLRVVIDQSKLIWRRHRGLDKLTWASRLCRVALIHHLWLLIVTLTRVWTHKTINLRCNKDHHLRIGETIEVAEITSAKESRRMSPRTTIFELWHPFIENLSESQTSWDLQKQLQQGTQMLRRSTGLYVSKTRNTCKSYKQGETFHRI